MADYITDIKIIEDFFRHRHFDIQMPDSTINNFDNGVADYYSRQKGLGKCLDTNGSEYLVYKIREDSTIEINFLFFERIFEKGRWDEKISGQKESFICVRTAYYTGLMRLKSFLMIITHLENEKIQLNHY